MNSHFTYLLILGFTLAGPLTLSFDKKVAFYKNWRSLFLAMIIPAIFYIAWDMYFTYKGVWSFNEKYYVGQIKVFNLPLEEILFFFIVPYCCVFIYECIRVYFPGIKNTKAGDRILMGLSVALLIIGIYFSNRQYTSWTFGCGAIFIALIYLPGKHIKTFNATAFLISFVIILIPFLIVNGYLTALPVVLYNNADTLRVRIYTIPFEDVFYGMLLVLMNVVFYEKLKARTASR